MNTRRVILSAIAALTIGATLGFAADYYVAVDGNDGNSGTSPDSAKATVAAGVGLASSSADTVHIGPGAFTIDANLTIDKGMTVRGAGTGVGPDATVLTVSGGKYLTVKASAVLSTMTFTNNYASWNGGPIRIDTATITNCFVINSKPSPLLNKTGGLGICAMQKALITHCVVSNMVADLGWGAGVALCKSSTMRNCLITGNKMLYQNSWNISGHGRGAAVYATDDSTIENCTIVDNYTHVGNAVYGNPTIRNCVIWGNTSDEVLDTPANLCQQSEKVTYTCTWPITGLGEGCTDVAPAFDAASGTEYRLSYASPCLNSGSNQVWMAGATDFFGNDRINGTIVDMGYAEFQGAAGDACTFRVDRTSVTNNQTVTFMASVNGCDPADATFKWNFGDGSAVHTVVGSVTTTHAYASYGNKTVTLNVEVGGTPFASSSLACVNVAPAVTYVDASSTGAAAPYDSPATAANSIQAAIDAVCQDGGTVRVADGSYTLSDTLRIGGLITVKSENGFENTFITPSGSASNADRAVQIFHPGAVFDGFTIQPMTYKHTTTMRRYSQCVLIGYGATMRNCRVYNATAASGSGTLIFVGNDALLDSTIVSNITIGAQYGAIVGLEDRATARNCLMVNNKHTEQWNSTSHCGITAMSYVKGAVAENCTVVGNVTTHKDAVGGITAINSDAEIHIRNCIIAHNLSGTTPTSLKHYKTISATCVYPEDAMSGAATFVQDPLFDGSGYALTFASPCVDTGTNQTWMTVDAKDLAGNPRLVEGISGNGDIVDLGCYEYQGVEGIQCSFATSVLEAPTNTAVTFSAMLVGGEASTATFQWDFDGDGTTDASGVGLANTSFAFTTNGLYTPKLHVESGGTTAYAEGYLPILPVVTYVKPVNASAAWPYDTEAKAATNFIAAMEATYNQNGTVRVCPGWYATDYTVTNIEAIAFRSVAGRAETVVSNSTCCAFYFSHADSVLDGLSIVYGITKSTPIKSGVVRLENGATMANCRVSGKGSFIGIQWVVSAGGYLLNNIFDDNDLNGFGALIRLSSGVLRNSQVSRYSNSHIFGVRPSVYMEGTSYAENCTIISNWVYCIGLAGISASGSSTIRNCILAFNDSENYNQNTELVEGRAPANANVASMGSSQLSYSRLYPATGDDMTRFTEVAYAEPAFRDLAAGDYRLSNSDTTCIDQGLNPDWAEAAGAVDLAGKPRISRRVIDIGCYEYGSFPMMLLVR